MDFEAYAKVWLAAFRAVVGGMTVYAPEEFGGTQTATVVARQPLSGRRA